MRVERIIPVTKTRYQVDFSDGRSYRVYKKDIKTYGFREEADLEEGGYQTFQKEMVTRAKLYVMRLLGDMDRTQAQLLQKLSQSGYPQEIAKEALDYVKSFGYVDDEAYIRRFTESRMEHKSRKEIYALLLRKGLDSSMISRIHEEMYQEYSDKYAITRIMEKKGWDPEQMDDGKRQKMYGYLIRKGFRYEDIRQVIQVSNSNA